jgi:peptide/nickel transport system permease protein
MATAPSRSPSGELIAPAGPPAAAARPRRARTHLLGGLTGFIIRRTLLGLLVLFIVSIIVFAATQALGDPARAILGRQATPEGIASLRQQLHLDRPVVAQYWSWLTGLLQGDAGTSFAAQEPVSTLINDRIVNTAFLVFCAASLSIPLAIFLGAYAALRRDRGFDNASSLVTLFFAAMPEFVIALWLVVIFATTVFPGTLPSITLIAPGARPWDDMEAMILPTAALVLAVTPYVARIVRASMIEVLESDYVEMARLKGLNERTVLVRHALPNALGPTFQVIAINLAYLAGGVILIEYIFNYAGIGGALRDGVLNHDIPVVQALAMLIAAIYVALNLLADIATILVTPRLRTRL